MKLTLTPTRGLPGQPETQITVSGDTITVDGVAYDLSPVPEGGEAVPVAGSDHPFVGKITRQGGVIACAVRVMLGDDATPDQPVDPGHWSLIASDGPVALPAERKETMQ